ncbi:integrase arm-type DNA-binding domain-containing protein, partial [Klebsiella pneumoniae]|uniref:integrase arm-type DNA-binding domain-containing protein n=1 Tax=Klebsiella pneumoniae TaxID=573 RepID=UPI00351D8E4D
MSLAGAREKARELRERIAAGVDPVAERQRLRAEIRAAQAKAITFEEAAHRCHDARRDEFTNSKHRQDWISSLQRHAFKHIGS